jgi:iron complex outermembrane receptor protein
MNKIFILSLILFSAGLAAFGQDTGKITGTVRLAGEDTVLHQVSMQLVELKRTTATDRSGNFEFAGVPPGRYTVVAHQEGFNDVSKKVDVAAGQTGSVDFELKVTGVKENVTVTASGVEMSTFESIAAVNTLDSSQITSRASVALGDVLENESGVAKRGGGAGSSRPVIRGFDGDRVLVSTDGVRVGSLASQSGDHSEPVDTLAAERIEIVKGPATLLYGSNAIGGVVNAISGHDEGAHPGLRGYFSGIGGTNNAQAAASGGVEYGIDKWNFWANGSGQRTSDYTAGGDFGTVQNTFTRSATGGAGFAYFAKKAFFSTNYSYYQNRYGIPLDFFDPAAELRSLRMHRHDLKFSGGLTDLDTFVTSAKFTVDLSNYQHQELEEDVVGTTFNNKVNSYRGMFEQKKSGVWGGRFGFEGYRRNYETFGAEVLVDGPVKQDSFSAFALQELTFDRMTLQFGGRVEKNRYDPTSVNLLDRTFTGFSGAAGAKFDTWKGGVFVANYSHGYRAPALEELYNNGPHDGTLTFEIGDQNLRPEISNGIDLSVRHQNERFKAEANYYYYAFKDFIYLAPTGAIDPGSGFPIAEYRQGDARFTGTELSLDVTANKYLNLIAGLDYVNAQLNTGQPLPRIAPLRGRFAADIHWQALTVRPEFVAVDRQDHIFTNETPTAGYGTVNLTASYIISRQHVAHVFSMNAYNLNNKLYFNHISFIKDISPEIGRGFRFSYTVRFF